MTQTFEPPSMRVLAVSEWCRILTEDVLSPLTPHTRSEHTMCITLSMGCVVEVSWAGGLLACGKRSIVAMGGSMGERMNPSKREQEGNEIS